MQTEKIAKRITYPDKYYCLNFDWTDLNLYSDKEFQNFCKDFEFVHTVENKIFWSAYIAINDNINLKFVKEFKRFLIDKISLFEARIENLSYLSNLNEKIDINKISKKYQRCIDFLKKEKSNEN